MLSPFLSVPQSCDETTGWLKQRLSKIGLRVMQTFDLHDARLGLEDCPCPHHGTNQCDCQMVVLLVYGNTSKPATLILHSFEGQTQISLTDRPGQRADVGMATAILRALDVKKPLSVSSSL